MVFAAITFFEKYLIVNIKFLNFQNLLEYSKIPSCVRITKKGVAMYFLVKAIVLSALS